MKDTQPEKIGITKGSTHVDMSNNKAGENIQNSH